MTDVDINGIGVWSSQFANWHDFCELLASGKSTAEVRLQPELISARERRRAPQSVKLAVEVMHQACTMAGIEPSEAATVFASGMGDMQLTDYMCSTLNTMPSAVSPTKFHNSVHNAATGYWSIATQSHAAANAISAYANSAAMALLEGAIQAVEEQRPVIVAVEETAAPLAFTSIYPSTESFGFALLLTPQARLDKSIAALRLGVENTRSETPTSRLADGMAGNFAASVLPLLESLASGRPASLRLPLSGQTTLLLATTPEQAQ